VRLTLVAFCVFIVFSVSGQKTDTIVHINGNVLTGEIKKLDYGIVTFKMDGMGTISFEIEKIQSIKSQKYFEMKLSNGNYYFGTFDTSLLKQKVKIVLNQRLELVNIKDIIEVYPIKKNFWLRLSGQFDLGFDFSKGSNVGKLNFNGYLNYRKRKSYYEFSWTNNSTVQSDTISSAKADISISYQRFLREKWSMNFQTGLNKNTELGLDVRAFVTALGIWDIIHNNRNRLYLGGGLSGNREWSNDSIGNNNLEMAFSTSYKLFKYISPKIDLYTDFTFFPSLSTKRRMRFEYNLNSKFEVFKDFYLGLNFYYSYDNKPITVTAAKDDWGVSTTIGYSFH
jgi:hypothetical protein